MNCLEEDIRYEVTLEPKHGTMEVGEKQGASTFTQLDVAADRVVYKHREPITPSDQFRYNTIKLVFLSLIHIHIIPCLYVA